MGKIGSGRRQWKLNGLKSKYRDCWVGGERFGFSRCEAAGADETEQKHLLRIFAAATLKKEFMENFCEVEDAECLAGFATVQTPETRKAESGYNITTKRAA